MTGRLSATPSNDALGSADAGVADSAVAAPTEAPPSTGKVEMDGVKPNDPSLILETRMAEATESIAFWTMVDGIGGAFTAVAAYFAFRAFRETRRQADATERQADEAKKAADAATKQAEASILALTEGEKRHEAQMAAVATQLRPQIELTQHRARGTDEDFEVRFVVANPGPSEIKDLQLFSGIRLRERGGDLVKSTPITDGNRTEPISIGAGTSEEIQLLFEGWWGSDIPEAEERHMYNLSVQCEIRWKDVSGYIIRETFELTDANFNRRNFMTQRLQSRRRYEYSPYDEVPQVGDDFG